MKVRKSFLLFFVCTMVFNFTSGLLAEDSSKKHFLVTKIGKADIKADRLRCLAEDKLMLLDIKKSTLSFWETGGKTHEIIADIKNPVDFDYSTGIIYLLYGKPGGLKKIYISSRINSPEFKKGENPVKIDSSFNLNASFAMPSAISVDRYNRYAIVTDTGSINSINTENKVFSLKFINYRGGHILFDSYTRSVYTSDYTTKSLVKLGVDGKLDQLISNFDCDNPFLLDVAGNLLVLDKKSGILAKLDTGKKFSILLENLKGMQSITMHRECDTILYSANNNSELFRIEEIPISKENFRALSASAKDDKIFLVNSCIAYVGKKSGKYYDLSKNTLISGSRKLLLGKSVDSLIALSKSSEKVKNEIIKEYPELVSYEFFKSDENSFIVKAKSGDQVILYLISKKNGNFEKKEIAKDFFISNPSVINFNEFLIINNEGKLLLMSVAGDKSVITGGLSGFSKILASFTNYCIVLSDKGELVKVNYRTGKTLLMKNVSKNSEIISSDTYDVVLRDGNKIYKLESGMRSITQYLMEEKPVFCFHRGYSAKAPENSIAAFDLALAKGGKFIEFDVQMTKDNELVILHDGTINRTSTGKGKISELNFADLDTVDIGSWFSPVFKGEKLPKFGDVLMRYKDKLYLDIELKGSGVKDTNLFCEKVINELKKHNMIEQVLITSFNRNLLRKVRSLNNEILTGLLIDNNEQGKEMDQFMDENDIDALVCNHNLLTKDLAGFLRSKNKMIMVYTVKEKKDYLRVREIGPDCIIANDPYELLSK